jgi:hypothetical protein
VLITLQAAEHPAFIDGLGHLVEVAHAQPLTGSR